MRRQLAYQSQKADPARSVAVSELDKDLSIAPVVVSANCSATNESGLLRDGAGQVGVIAMVNARNV